MIGYTILSNVRNIGYVRGDEYGFSERSRLPVTIELELRGSVDIKAYELSITGTIWRPRKHDCVACGQINDELRELLKKKALILTIPRYELEKLLDIWDVYHLNDIKPVPEEDKDAFLEFIRKFKKKHGFYPPMQTIREVFPRYGNSWYFWRIPRATLRWLIAKWFTKVGDDVYGITNSVLYTIDQIEEILKEEGVIRDD